MSEVASFRELRRPGAVVLSQWRRIVPATLAGIFVAEFLVMLLFDSLGIPQGFSGAVLDAALLTVLILPGLFLVVLVPVASLATRLAATTADARFRAVVEAAGDSILLADRHGRIHYANRAAAWMLGYSAEEMSGLEIAMLVPEELREAHSKGLRRYLETGEGRVIGGAPLELEARARDGTHIPIEITLNATPMSADGLIIAVLRDLRQRKRMGLYEVLLPVCCVCGDIRDDTGAEHGRGTWVKLEKYVQVRSPVRFSHTFCPDCYASYAATHGLSPAGAVR